MSQILPHNPFFFFVKDWIKEKEKSGYRFSSFTEAYNNPHCTDAWKSLPSQKKGMYKVTAKKYKYSTCYLEKKKTLLEESKTTLEKIEKQRFQIEKDIVSLVRKASIYNAVQDLKFHFIHVNWFYINERTKEYAPAEFALAEFSLKNGIARVYHTIICTKSALGYAREAMKRSEDSHKVPLSCPEGQSDFSVMYQDLISFLRPNSNDKTFSPLYAEKSIFEAAKSFLRQLSAAANNDENPFAVYPLEILFTALGASFKLKNYDEDDDINDVVKNSYFPDDKFYHVPDIECRFHENIDCTNIYCSLAIVKRWGYIICDSYCDRFKLNMKPGFHCPPNSSNDEKDLQDKINRLTLENAGEPLTAEISEDNLKISKHTNNDKHQQSSSSSFISKHQQLYADTNRTSGNNVSNAFDLSFPPIDQGAKYKSKRKRSKK